MSRSTGDAATSIPATAANLDRAWLTAALRSTGTLAPKGIVVDVGAERLARQGLFAAAYRVTVTYEGDAADAPHTLVAKLSSSTPAMRDRPATRRAYATEVNFYRHLSDRVNLPTPQCFYADIDPNTGLHVLLLEDLAPAESIPTLTGASPEQAEQAILAAADFHAGWWEQPGLRGIDWMRDPSFDTSALRRLHDQWWPVFEEKAGHQLSANLTGLGERLGDHRGKIMIHLFGSAPRTLIHRDYSLSNMMFATDAGGAPFTVIDWQSVCRGHGLWDVGLFLGQSLEIDQRRRIESDLLHAYHGRLVDRGVSDYGFDACLRDYRYALLQRFGALISTIAAMPFSEDEIQQHIDVLLPRNIAAMADHDVAAVLDS